MIEALNKIPGLTPDPVPATGDERMPTNITPEASRATPDDEAAATDPDGRTNDGPATHNRTLPPDADHGGRDSAETV